MKLPVLSPDKFAEWFNVTVPGAYRKLTAQDIRDMAECRLIGKYGYYDRNDIEVVRAVLQYEQLREQRRNREDRVRLCKRCGQPLPDDRDGRGRPKEYCSDCESFRERERNRKWRTKNMASPISSAML